MSQIEIFHAASDMPPSLYYQAETFVRITWADDPEYNMDDGLLEPAVHVCLHDGNTLYSYASIIEVDVVLLNESYSCLGVRSVFTFPASRNRGLASQVLTSINKYFEHRHNVDIALLWTETQNTKLYERAGWEPQSVMTTLYGDPDSPNVFKAELAMMKFLSSKAQERRELIAQGKLFIGEEPW